MNFVRIILLLFVFNLALFAQLLPDYKSIDTVTSNEAISKFLTTVNEAKHISVFTEGKSAGGNPIYSVKLSHSLSVDPWKILLYGQQHGNEHAGKEALLYLIQNIYGNPDWLPDNVELWIIPSVNPDGNAADQRRNANNKDLNRDHILLSQPETQILHNLARKIMPHVAVDCHEFTRDSRDYRDKGWLEWPLIMMDTANNPLFDPDIYKAGVRWCEQIAKPLEKKGFNYTRYYVGGLPPNEEQRHSTLEMDDARNGLGAYGGLSFIIESGVKRDSENPQEDLAQRIEAYLTIFEEFIKNDSYHQQDKEIISKSRTLKQTEFIPVNYFWGNVNNHISYVNVIDKSSGDHKHIPTMNFMNTRVIKKAVTRPSAYLIDAQFAGQYKELLDRHGIKYLVSGESKEYSVESIKLNRIEDFFDPVYARYAGRAITDAIPDTTMNFSAGHILVELNKPFMRKVILLLEPQMMYGLYQYAEFKNFVDKNKGVIPVYRIKKNEKLEIN